MLLEPFGRNTAPAVAIAAMQLLAEGRDELMLVMPADHVLEDQRAFQQALALATIAAEKGEMVLFGVPALRPETGYGYIRGKDSAGSLPDGISRVAQFVEKPDAERAQQHFWNSGMFLFRASRFLDELKHHDVGHLPAPVTIDAATFACCPDNSIDYAVMEKTQRACVVPLSAGWNDVGSWSSIWEVHDKDRTATSPRATWWCTTATTAWCTATASWCR